MGAVQFSIMKDLLSTATELSSRLNKLADKMSRVMSKTGTYIINGENIEIRYSN